MRLAFVTETYPPEINGVALTVQSLIESLRERDHRVEVIRPRQSGDRAAITEDELCVAGSALPRYPGLRFGWPARGQLKARWRANRPDAVYIATEGPLGYSALGAARALDIPVLTGFHTRFDDYLGHYGIGVLKPAAVVWLRRFHNRAQATLVPTPALRAELMARGHDNVLLLRRGIDAGRFSPARRSETVRASWGIGPNDLAVLYVGRLAPEKNFDLLLASFRAIHAQRPDARLVLIGDGPARAALEESVPEGVFCGVRTGDELAANYASGDLFVFPSLSETYGNVTLEAMASGVPVVAYAQGAALEHLRDEVSGAAVTPGDAPAFIAACVSIATDASRRSGMRSAARAAVASLLPQQVAIDYENLVLQVAAKTEQSAPTLTHAGATQGSDT